MDQNKILSKGVFIEKMTSPSILQNLINKLHPIKTQYELIRVGGNQDGGYLLPNDLDDIEACFSPGVDVTANFEIDLLGKNGINSHQLDYSVDGPPSGFEPLSFTKKFLGNYCDDKYITFDEWVKKYATSSKDLILQMDIEGAEYISINGVSEDILKKFRIILIEIHLVQSWGCPDFFNYVVNPFFNKILRNFSVVHNHPNNCCGVVDLGGVMAPRVFELTLLRNERIKFKGFKNKFPNKDDFRNVSFNPEIVLSENWYRKP